MGANLSTANCCGGRVREDEQDPIESSDLLEWAETIGNLQSSRERSDATSTVPADHPASKAIKQKQDDKLQGKINAIVAQVTERKGKDMRPDAEPFVPSPMACTSERKGKDMRLDAEPFVPSPMACTSRLDLQNEIDKIVQNHAQSLKEQRLSATPGPSPSPAKFVADPYLSYVADRALSNAKERKTPASSPSQMYPDSTAPGGEFVRRHLTFADCDNALAAQKMSDGAQTSRVRLVELPSPTCDVPMKTEKARWADEEHEAMETEKAKEEQAEMLEMDKMCVNTFLECVKTCAWRERVRTPIKGTNLYIKHMRPCRPAFTSVDVKDSNFKNLRTFLLFLEAEGLLRLQPGLTDPVVTEIRFKACRDYVYLDPFSAPERA